MSQVSAFVAHSFRTQDEDHVRKFLSFLDHLADTNADFSWDHALSAKPQDLRQKVFEKIENKNLLIAICSKHSYAIDPSSLKKSLFGSKIYLSEDEIVWMTSGWIIQEIGLALGRGMELILLIEQGVRTPGGLQGNIEYIEFVREAPERAFTRVMEMVNTLIGARPITAVPATVSPPEETNSGVVQEKLALQAPVPGMSLEELERGRFFALIDHDANMVNEYSSFFLESEWGKSDIERARWEAREQLQKQIIDGNGSILTIRAFRSKYPSDPVMANIEARYLERMGEPMAAAKCYEIAAQNYDDIKKKIYNYNSAARVLSVTKNWLEVEKILTIARVVVEQEGCGGELEQEFLEEFSKIYEGQDKITKAASLERILEVRPDDISMRFNLAYLYGEMKMHDISLYHYDRVPYSARSEAVWNNYGVAASELDIKGASVAAYKRAIQLGNTLASSNIARLQCDAGFLDEAEEGCRSALQGQECDPQVGETLSTIARVRDVEKNKFSEVRNRAERFSLFLRLAGQACTSIPVDGLPGTWRSPQCSLQLVENGSSITMHGTYERETTSLFTIANGGKKLVKVNVVFNGIRYGNAIFGSLIRRDADELSTLLGRAGDEYPCYVYLGKDSSALSVLEVVSPNSDYKYYELSR